MTTCLPLRSCAIQSQTYTGLRYLQMMNRNRILRFGLEKWLRVTTAILNVCRVLKLGFFYMLFFIGDVVIGCTRGKYALWTVG